ncbi:hypothetical protein ABZ816_39305 [Actinosynnema sp. NPDC047251]|uniref:Putative membrane protein n=1 Tax=Saccharothrix espanaensis (strain ATCC 51144 / DSM 44229 / JCM 9112 / NBRC 15066 / NRRL 15764) TaxID=1179773 RepID=K0JSV9_SACES|nr:hypothetical protein [Saccharothrix espanaensis]CCH28966.1 putative membrane protein [Saccharothrix espanaensis DSM 44229]
MNSRRDSTDGPEDVDATFAEIVAGLEREGVGRTWPDADDAAADAAADAADDAADEEAEPAKPARSEGRPAVATADADPDDEPDDDPDDHFVPPDPPPLPALRAGTVAALLLILLGVVLLLFPSLFGLTPTIGTPVALVVLCSGAGWLVLRIRNGPPPDSGWDDGAVL